MRRVWRPSAKDLWAGRRPLWWTAGPAGELAVLLVHRKFLRRNRYVKGWVGWGPKVPFDGVLVIRQADGSVQRRPIKDVPVRPSHIALLPESRLLIASGRARKEEVGAWKANAVVFSLESGKQEDAFCIGDDIPALVTDREGSIWTAYGDEGIYGGIPSPQPVLPAGMPKETQRGPRKVAFLTCPWRAAPLPPRTTGCG